MWFLVDDNLSMNKKVQKIPQRRRAAAMGVWTLAGSWSAGELTEGFVPDYMLAGFCGTPQITADLVAAGLWMPVVAGSERAADGAPTQSRRAADPVPTCPRRFPDDGHVFVNWPRRQPSKDTILSQRSTNAARQQAYRDRQKIQLQDHRNAVTDALVTPSVTPPIPNQTKPNQETTLSPSGRERASAPAAAAVTRTRGTPIDPDFAVDDAMKTWAETNVPGLNIEQATTKFVNYWQAESGGKAIKKNWVAAWRFWLLRDFEQNGRNNSHANAVAVRGGNGAAVSTTDQRYEHARSLGREMQAAEDRRNGAR